MYSKKSIYCKYSKLNINILNKLRRPGEQYYLKILTQKQDKNPGYFFFTSLIPRILLIFAG
jgi:hypothetical protein